MKEIRYKDFSLKAHQKNWRGQKPNLCQFELTFKCGLHCRHCYSDCYNNPYYIKKELGTEQVKFILDKVHNSGVIWLCLTGGDPLARNDFLEIYSYAKEKGFIITIFTNGYSITEDIADYFKERPPFVIEITLNSVNKRGFEDISGVEGSFERAMAGIAMIVRRGLPLKIKTQVTKQNLQELRQIGEFVKGLGLRFSPSFMLHARLNGDTTPCSLRISPRQVLKVSKGSKPVEAEECERQSARDEDQSHPQALLRYQGQRLNKEYHQESKAGQQSSAANYPGSSQGKEKRLFRCVVGSSDGFYIDPYGNMITCVSIRKPGISLLRNDIAEAHHILSSKAGMRGFKTDSKCRHCSLRDLCRWCPGWALLERGDIESPIEYFCELAYLTEKDMPSEVLTR